MSKETIMHSDSDYEAGIYKKKKHRAALGTRIRSKQTIIHYDSDYETGIYEKEKKSRCFRYNNDVNRYYYAL